MQEHLYYFSKRERTGIMVLLALIFATVAATHIYIRSARPMVEVSDSTLIKFGALKTVFSESGYGTIDSSISVKNDDVPIEKERFVFDPNTLEDAGWLRLGVNKKVLATIRKYLFKGGKFRKPDDLKKVWGLAEADELVPWVRLGSASLTGGKFHYESGVNVQQQVDVNTADSLAWLSLPGIGPSLTRRILAFRKRLGGFYSENQVGETFGLADSTFKKIKSMLVLRSRSLKRIDINLADENLLKEHPYIRYKLAKGIVSYRNEHGKFQQVSDLKKLAQVTDSIYVKVEPYLMIGNQ